MIIKNNTRKYIGEYDGLYFIPYVCTIKLYIKLL